MSLSPFILLCATGLFAVFSSTISKSPVLPLFTTHIGADPAEVGFIASVSAFTGVVFSMPAGMLSDRLGRRRMLLFSLAVFSTAPFLYLMVTQLWQLALVRFYHGLATAIFVPVAMAMVADHYQHERGEKMGWFSTATLLGRFAAPAIGGGILGAYVLVPVAGFQIVFIVCAIAGTLAFLIAVRIPDPGEGQKKLQSWKESAGAFRTIASNRPILITSTVEASILFAYGTFETFLPLYAIERGLTAFEAGIFLSSQVITLALTKPVMGRFSDRHGRSAQILAGTLMGAGCIGSFAVFSTFVPLLLLSILFGLSLSVVTSATSAFIADLSKRESYGSAMGVLGSIMDIGHTAGPIAAGLAAAYWGLRVSFAGAAAVLVFASFVFFRFMMDKEKAG